MTEKTPHHIKLDERKHVEKPLLDQLAGLGWEILDLDSKQHPSDSFRQSFTEVVMLPVLREQIKGTNSDYYRLRADNYRVFYMIEGNCAIVLRILNKKDVERFIRNLN